MDFNKLEGKVLIVEKNGRVATIIAQMFNMLGFYVKTTPHIHEVMPWLERNIKYPEIFPDAAVMDIAESEMETTKKTVTYLKQHRPQISIFISSANPQVLNHFLAQNDVNVLSNPLEHIREAATKIRAAMMS